MPTLVGLIEAGSVRDYQDALQLCAGRQVSRQDIALAFAAHIALTNGSSTLAKSTRIRVMYDAYLRHDLSLDEAMVILKEVQRRIDLRTRGSGHFGSTFALQYGYARDVFVDAVTKATSYEHFLSLAQTMSTCSSESGCKEARNLLINFALTNLSSIEQFREIYRLIGYV